MAGCYAAVVVAVPRDERRAVGRAPRRFTGGSRCLLVPRVGRAGDPARTDGAAASMPITSTSAVAAWSEAGDELDAAGCGGDELDSLTFGCRCLGSHRVRRAERRAGSTVGRSSVCDAAGFAMTALWALRRPRGRSSSCCRARPRSARRSARRRSTSRSTRAYRGTAHRRQARFCEVVAHHSRSPSAARLASQISAPGTGAHTPGGLVGGPGIVARATHQQQRDRDTPLHHAEHRAGTGRKATGFWR